MHTPVVAVPRSYGLSSRSAPAAHDTWRVRPACVPPPTSGPESSSHRWPRAVPLRCDGDAVSIGRRRRSHDQSDCRRPSPDRGAGVPLPWAGAAPAPWPRGWRPRAWCHGRLPRRWSRPAGLLSPRPRGCVLPLFPAVGGVAAYQVAPHAGCAHGGVGGLPLPLDAVQPITGLHQHCPEAAENPRLTPALEVSMDGAVIPQCLREAVPLASCAQTKDDAVEWCIRGVDPRTLHLP
jgi:hypothetical protein